MPKNWASIKTELERLYVTEGKPLDQVKEILLSTHGFDASTRMYRLKLVQWGIRKYKCNNEGARGQQPTPSVEPEESDEFWKLFEEELQQPTHFSWHMNHESPQLSPVDRRNHSHDNNNHHRNAPPTSLSSTTDPHNLEKFIFGYGVASNDKFFSGAHRLVDGRIPPRPMRLSELLPYIRDHYPPEHALEALLHKWQADGEYMNCAISWLKDPAYCKNLLGSSQTGGNHFKLIDENVPFPERLVLTKQFLKASIVHNSQPSDYIWSLTWYATQNLRNWQTVKNSLFGAYSISMSETGSAFHLCALVVMAEEILQGYKNQLASFRAESLTPAKISEARTIRQEYVAILKDDVFLKDFHDQDIDLDLSFYKYSLEIFEWNESLAAQDKSKTERLLTKYRRLVGLWMGKDTFWIDRNVDGLISGAERGRTPANNVPLAGTSFKWAITQSNNTSF